jgi:hypothetical protein
MGVDLKLESAMQYTAKLDRKEVKNKEAEITAMYLNNSNGRNRHSDRKKDDGKKPVTRIEFSSVVPGERGLSREAVWALSSVRSVMPTAT